MPGKTGILTDRQAEVLKYEMMGYTQEEISKLMGISQPRVSAALKRAKEKIEEARATLDFYREIQYIKEMKDAGFQGELVLDR